MAFGQRVDEIELFPGEILFVPTEVPVRRRLAVDRAEQIEPLDDAPRGHVDFLHDDLVQLGVGNPAGAEGVDMDGDRLGDADGIGDLDQALVGEAGGDQVLGEMPCRIRRAPVHLGRILSGECSAAVRCPAAVGVDDDLASGQAGVAVRAADFKPPGRVDVDDQSSCRAALRG